MAINNHERVGKPCLHLHAGVDVAMAMREFLEKHLVTVLNVAGPRESTEPGIGAFAMAALEWQTRHWCGGNFMG